MGSGGQNWGSVGLIVLGCFFVGEALTRWLSVGPPPAPLTALFQKRCLHIGIPTLPLTLGVTVSLGLLALLTVSRHALPRVIFYLGAAFLAFRVTMLFFLRPLLARLQEPRVSFTDPKIPRWMLKPSFVKGYASGFRGGRGLAHPEAVVYATVGVFAFHGGGWALPGNSLIDARFGFLVYVFVCVVSMLLHPTYLQSLPGLVVLRRDLLANTITPADAYLGVTLIQAGVLAAADILVGKQRVTAMTNAILKAIEESPELPTRLRALSKEKHQSDPLGAQVGALEGVVARLRAEVHAAVIMRPEADPALLGVLGEMEKSMEQLRSAVFGQDHEDKDEYPTTA